VSNLKVAIPEDSDDSDSSDSSSEETELKIQPIKKKLLKENMSYIKHLIIQKTKPSIEKKIMTKSKSNLCCTNSQSCTIPQ